MSAAAVAPTVPRGPRYRTRGKPGSASAAGAPAHPFVHEEIRRDSLRALSAMAWKEIETKAEAVGRAVGKTRQLISARGSGSCGSWHADAMEEVWSLEAAGVCTLPLLLPLAAVRRAARMRRQTTDQLWERLLSLIPTEQRIAAEADQLQMQLLVRQEIPQGFGRKMLRQAAVSLTLAALSGELYGRRALRRAEVIR